MGTGAPRAGFFFLFTHSPGMRRMCFFLIPALLAASDAPKQRSRELAVIVNPKNSVTNLKHEELYAILTLDRQFWSSHSRVVLFLPPSESMEKKILLEKIYHMTNEELRKYWISKLYAGAIPALPSVVRTTAAAGSMVRKSDGAIAVVPAEKIPEGVTVLKIDGKKPGEPGYTLLTQEEQ